MSSFNSNSEDHISPIPEGGQLTDVIEHEAESLDIDDSSSGLTVPQQALDAIDGGAGSSSRSEALGRGISSMLEGIIKDFDSKAVDTARSQDQLSGALDRLTRELDQLLEDAPVPFIKQHAGRISGVRDRVSSMNTVLRSIQRRIDNIDRILTVRLPHGHVN
ncbi:hypothetical protein V2J09_023416 [Rumex salicifolius]